MKQTALPLPDSNAPFAAANAMVAAMAVLGIVDNLVPLMADTVGVWQFFIVRTLISIPLIALMAWCGLGRMSPVRWGAVAVRSLLAAISMVFYFTAVALMPIAQAIAGLFTSPAFVVVISVLFMGLRIGPFRILAVVLGFAGVLFVLQPDLGDFDWLILLPVAGGVFYALSAIATRSLCEGESTLSMLLGMLLAQAFLALVALLGLSIWPADVPAGADGFAQRGWVWPMWDILHWAGIHAVGSLVGIYLIIKAYQLGETSFVAVFEYSIMLVGPGFAWLVFGQSVDGWQVFGIGLIILAGAILAVRSR
ncbi:MAG: EamA family transporter [Rhodobacteraceae bacterium]|nr:EamA family transporter [Paracoccaceae bacterium]